jgi:hypothetical protein
MNQFEIEMEGRKDKNGDDYYVAVTKIPVQLDLSNAVVLIFPWEKEDQTFGARMLIKKFQPRQGRGETES